MLHKLVTASAWLWQVSSFFLPQEPWDGWLTLAQVSELRLRVVQ